MTRHESAPLGHPVRTAILGASGYTGGELLRLLAGHPGFRLVALSADSQAGKPMSAVFPHLAHLPLPPLQSHAQIDFSAIDFVFCCLPHGTTQEIIAALPGHLRIVDLSADFRLYDLESYAYWYEHPHRAPHLQPHAVYGLTEFRRPEILSARLVANPGCYPTCTLLALCPPLAAGLLEPDSLRVTALSGVSGAGRGAKQSLLYSELEGGVSAYGIGHHRHMAEIEQELTRILPAPRHQPLHLSFTPLLVPMTRGMLATISALLAPGATVEDVRAALAARYDAEAFVTVLPAGLSPATQAVRGTNRAIISVHAGRARNEVILVSAIDNLMKGASGQALQNANVMLGFPEHTGLESAALFP